MRRRPSIQTQILIFTLFGEYITLRGGSAWTSSLLTLLHSLGVSERAARSTLSRMKKKGWLTSMRNGRYSRYSLTQRGAHVVRGAKLRIFEPRQREWNGLWHMVIYSVPEGKRRLRSNLRKRLGWLGFGWLAPGAWISPNDRRPEVEAELEDLGAREFAVYFSDMQLHYATHAEIVGRCWDLASVNESYREFLNRYEASFLRHRREFGAGSPAPWECFRQRFWLALDYAQFPRQDPNLPPELLPADWLGTRANTLFTEYHELLAEPTEAFVDQVFSPDRPAPARLLEEIAEGVSAGG